MILNKFIVLICIFLLFNCTKEKNILVINKDNKQIQYFDNKGNVYKIENYKNDSVDFTTYLLNKKDSTIFKDDPFISVLEDKGNHIFLSKFYNKYNLSLHSMGTLLDLGKKRKSEDFLPIDTWIIFDKGKLSQYYYFYLTTSGSLLLTQIISYKHDESIDLSQSNYIKISKEAGEIYLNLHSCCYDARYLFIGENKVTSISKNKWFIDPKYYNNSSIEGYILLNPKKGSPILRSIAIGQVPSLKQSDTLYFYEKIK
ncbi:MULTISPECIES: hypothetical protein [unclassified Apibacter]|uniref:hypothetical protein n=1 Tax=unclassified Apibacter TaxID=2630820 RepID=UPI0013238E30|nr:MULTISPECIES: hypothetical protein [unclassified Apibacter]MCX8677789.1 hypothetical protein [Apibacter sp. B3919]MXO25065.1 hypothetical protein [Apibacter sp. B3924]MXO27184.1 hypothetical protein [Apibacter sp. B3813]MXO28997.1 hypothetical protein [Apibacter sp. B3913]MXO31222.1 hypothetical protein [Apibacter sp. B3912]